MYHPEGSVSEIELEKVSGNKIAISKMRIGQG